MKRIAAALLVLWCIFVLGIQTTYAAGITISEETFMNAVNNSVGTTFTSSMCLGWVKTFWSNLGANSSTDCCAYHYSVGAGRIVSTSKSNIPIGANVYFHGGSSWYCPTHGDMSQQNQNKNGNNCGHVGIYVGDGKVVSLRTIDGKTSVGIDAISSWETWGKSNGYYKYAGWGWHDGVVVSSVSYLPPVAYENCTYKITKAVTMRKTPYDSGDKGSSLSIGQTITSDAIVDNGTNYWLQVTAIDGKALSSKQYIFSGYSNKGVQNGNQYLQYVSTNPNVRWEGNDISGMTHQQGNFHAVIGTIKSNNTIKSITAEFHKGESCWGVPVVASPVNSTEYRLPYSTIDNNMKFGSLPTGSYNFVWTVEYYTNRKLSTATYTAKIPFTVVSSGSTSTASTLKFSNVTYPKTFRINTTNGWSLGSGTLSSNYALKTIRSQIVDSSGKSISDSGVKSISGTSYTIKNLDDYSGTNNGVRFSWITTAGSYKWILTATDSSGKSLTLTMPFTAVTSGSTSTATASSEYVTVTSVALSANTVSLKVGETKNLTATILPSNASNNGVTWSSSNTSVATVSSSGKITAVANGTATITCKTADGGYTASCSVTVTTPVTGVSLNSSSASLNVGGTKTLTATITPSTASNKSVTWSSNNTSVATVSSGKITAIGNGTATITCKTADGGYSAACVVTVTTKVTGVSLNSTSVQLNVGNTSSLTATVSPVSASNKSVTWSSSNTAVATVSGGKVTAVANGTATITCKTADGGYTAACTVTVKTPVSGVTLDRDSATLKAGESFTLVPTVLPSTASNKKVTWSSGNTAVATVANGKVTAVSNGTASIYCSTEEGGYQVYCKVYVIDPVDLGSDFYAVIRHIDSGKLVDAESISNLANIHLTTEIFNESQIWHFVRQSDGYYKILQGEYLMELAGGNIADDTNIRLYRENDNAAQHWYIHKDGEGYHLTSRKAPGSCVDVRGNNSADGTNVQLFTENNTEGQRFSIEKCTLVSSLRLDANKIELNSIGESKSVTATVLPSNATYRNITWASDDLAVATVVDGTVVAVGSGITTITCTIDGSGHSASCRVIVYGEKLLKLPAALLQIDAEAFRYSIMDAVIVPEKAESIGSKAFADCDDLRIIYMPDSVVQIAEDAFDGSDNVCFVCESENAAATYAKKYSIPYVVE